MGRRAHGDGSLFKRGDGYWVAGIQLPAGPDGRRRYKRVVRKNRNDAAAELRKLRADLAAGRIATAPTTTVAKWLDYWQTEILPHRNIKPGTTISYRNTIRLYLKPHLGARRVDRLQPADIRRMYNTLTADVSSRAAQKADQVLRLAIKAAVREGVLGANVMDRVDKPAHRTKPQTAFTAATAVHIIETAVATQGPVWGARWMLGFTTGAREGEVLGLEWERVNLDRAVIDISWQLQRLQKNHGCGPPDSDGRYPCGKVRVSFCPDAHWQLPAHMEWRECVGSLVWTRPKTSAGTRIVPLLPDMVAVLHGLRDSDGVNPHGLVLHHPDGKPFAPDQDQRAWRNLLKAASVPHVPQHTVRHSTATVLLEAGVDSHITQQVIGHSNVAVTRGYQHVDLELARQAWSNLAALLPKKS